MNYGTVIGGIITAPISMCSSFEGIGGWHTLTDAERAEHGWYPCDMINEGYDSSRQIRSTEPVLTFDGERIAATYTIVDKTFESIQGELLNALAAYRYGVECGVVVSPGGVSQSCVRFERLLLADKLAFMTANPSVVTTAWKAGGEWFKLTHSELSELQTLVGMHVDKCYTAENAVAMQVFDAATVDDLLAINVASAFDEQMAT